jgi:MATE family multidrug resistance protein
MPVTHLHEAPPSTHPFLKHPHGTLLALSFPVLISLIAEPLTGLVDTAFVARLGSIPLAALGVGTVVLSGTFWIFNFLGIGTQTEVARSLGAGERERAREVSGLAMGLGVVLGVGLLVVGVLAAGPVASAMGAAGGVREGAVLYLKIRLLGMPALLIMSTAFGALRGMQDMKTPLRVAVSINLLNIVLDAVLIFGVGPIPAMGIAGAAWATAASHWVGAVWALLALRKRLGLPSHLKARDAGLLFVVGRDLFLRTALLTGFLLLTTRAATRIGADAGAAHQAIRQVWLFAALTLDAFAASAQSLVGYFLGAQMIGEARRVARFACVWSFGTGLFLAVGMVMAQGAVAVALVPEAARSIFGPAWIAAAVAQPVNALSFATDGIHWGTSDYRFLRNAMFAATASGAAGLLMVHQGAEGALTLVWIITGVWIGIRALFGMTRIWPGFGASPLSATPRA